MTRSLIGSGAGGLALCMALFSSGCNRERPAQAAPPPPTVSVAKPVMYPVQTYYEYNGNLDAVEMVQITARVKGFLTDVAFTDGSEVKQGDLLFKIDPREYAATLKRVQADRQKAVVELKRARTEEDRLRTLRTGIATSPEEFELKVAAREAAEAVVLQTDAALEAAKLQLGYTEIRSPIDGQISRTLVTRGNLVGQNENAVLTTIVSMDPLYVYFDVPERDLVEYQQALRARSAPEPKNGSVTVEVGVVTEEGYPHVGQIDFRENRVDTGTGTVRIRGRIPNPRVPPGNARLLYPGLYARVRIPAGEPKLLPALPEDALMTGQEGLYVYVVDETNTVQKRTVKVGPQVTKALPPAAGQPAGWTLVNQGPPPAASKVAGPQTAAVQSVVAIENGLTSNDRVVVNGLTKARPGAKVAPETWILTPPPAAR